MHLNKIVEKSNEKCSTYLLIIYLAYNKILKIFLTIIRVNSEMVVKEDKYVKKYFDFISEEQVTSIKFKCNDEYGKTIT